ncbi:MAG TPA: outer membrane beta-barrel protein [Thermoanaerobaculia bacterium]|nr:outer membrane beta-barrel protein [Thermoanaerobaculia bacterium]
MTGSTVRRIVVSALAGLALVAGAAEAQQRVTLRALYGNVTSLSGTTSLALPDVFAYDLAEKKQWYGLDLDLHVSPGLSLDLTASRGKIEETLTVFPPQQSAVVLRHTGTLRHDTLSLLIHPVPGQWVDFYFGPSYGQAHYDRSLASSESETAVGGKVGLDLHLGESGWLVGAQLTVLTSGLRIVDGEPKHNVRYSVLGAGVGYRF